MRKRFARARDRMADGLGAAVSLYSTVPRPTSSASISSLVNHSRRCGLCRRSGRAGRSRGGPLSAFAETDPPRPMSGCASPSETKPSMPALRDGQVRRRCCMTPAEETAKFSSSSASMALRAKWSAPRQSRAADRTGGSGRSRCIMRTDIERVSRMAACRPAPRRTRPVPARSCARRRTARPL